MAGSSHFDVLVTGSSGHLGTALMLSLPALGYVPYGIDVLASETTHRTGSIADRGFVSSVVAEHASIKHILHAATLHKPHVESHSQQDFIDTNITGTLCLLEAAKTLPNLESFVFISTTSTFGNALRPGPGRAAAWIDEGVTPQPKNIYGVTKVAAEDLCLLAHRQAGFPVLVLRTSRFFPEADDEAERRDAMPDDNLKVLELTYRRVDIADIVSACHCAMRKASDIGWGKYIISAPPPFANDPALLDLLNRDAETALVRVAPTVQAAFLTRGWTHLPRIDRVYDSTKAMRDLDWRPYYTFARAIEQVTKGEEWRSELSLRVGKKGYHAVSTGVYTSR